jgi:integral membrane protein (TIGR01906 family)
MMENKAVRVTIQVVIAVLVVLVVILTGVRLLLSDFFLKIEYNMPYFPEDSYGMTKEERLFWSPYALDYLLNSEEISFLGDLIFEDGSALFNERELSHMLDVKILVQQALRVWYVSLAAVVLIGGWAWRRKRWSDFSKMLSTSGLISVVLLGTMVLIVFLSFKQLFTGFHRIFFEGDSWLFKFSDTLIRLFPMRFWQDAFIFVGVFTLVVGISIWRLGAVRQPGE